MDIRVVSVDSLIIYFGDTIEEHIALKIKKAYSYIKNLKLEGVIEIIPSYTSIFISYDVLKYDFETLKNLLKKSLTFDYENSFEEKIITIDVYYGLEVGFDLKNISLVKNLKIEEIIQIHSNKIYDVYAIGFFAGFCLFRKN